MFGSVIVDVAIGLIFCFFVFSLVGTVVTEWVAGVLKLRSKTLETGIRQLLSDPGSPRQQAASDIKPEERTKLADDLYDHPLIKALFTQRVPLPVISRWTTPALNKPGYIPTGTFTLALLDQLTTKNAGTIQSMTDIRKAVEKMPPSKARDALQALVNAGSDLPSVRKNVEDWFDAAMDRVSGFYKRQAQLITILIGAVIAISLNVDTVLIGNQLFHDEALRNAIVGAAQQVTTTPSGTTGGSDTTQLEQQLAAAPIPIGWAGSGPQGLPGNPPWGWLAKLAGLLLTTIAISVGAPFWFDLLKRIMNIRSSGPEPKADSMASHLAT
jgi:hypothetical protein